jgi:hypothetical protein
MVRTLPKTEREHEGWLRLCRHSAEEFPMAKRVQTPLMCDRKGRLVLPDPSILSPDFHGTIFSEHDLDIIYVEATRGRWRVTHYLRLIIVLGSLIFTCLVWPVAASH